MAANSGAGATGRGDPAARNIRSRDLRNEKDKKPAAARLRLLPDDALGWMAAAALAFALGVCVFVLVSPQEAGKPGFILAAGAAIIALIAAFGIVTTASGGLTRAARAKTLGEERPVARRALGAVAARILETDPDPILVARRDGVAMFANRAYMALARRAGLEAIAGVPPRIDRVFAGDESQASALFRLSRAARAGAPASAELSLRLPNEPAARRFHVAAKPVDGDGDSVLWRIRDCGVEAATEPAVIAHERYESLPAPVLLIDRLGRLLWRNAAAREIFTQEAQMLDELLELEEGALDEAAAAGSEGGLAPAAFEARLRHDRTRAVQAQLGELRLRANSGAAREDSYVLVLNVERATAQSNRMRASAAIEGYLNDAPFGFAVIDGDPASGGTVAQANAAFRNAFAMESPEAPIAGLFPADVLAELATAAKRKPKTAARGAAEAPAPIEARAANGRTYHLYCMPAKRRRGSWGVRLLLYAVDVTERKQMEEQYVLGQKLQAVGKLAGGVAHDFNNILTVIIGNCDMLMARHSAGDPSYPDLVQIKQNANRAAALVRKLLAFSRKQTLQPKVCSVTDLINDFKPFLRRTLTEKVKLSVVNGRDLFPIQIDKNQFEVAIMNLAVNARDAMTDGGELTIATRNISKSELASFGYPLMAENDYVLVEVSDTGEGMPPDVLDKIFEPFFTTKDEGKGNGLGLSTVYGIVKQTGGYIFAESPPGQGAIFRIFLPASFEVPAAQEEEAKPTKEAPADLTGSGRILIVEDEDAVRAFVARALTSRGYEIEEAADGEEALELLSEKPGAFDLVISDVMMPGLDGPAFIERAKEYLGRAKVVFISGYAETAIADSLTKAENVDFLPKPFTLKTLAEKVKQALSHPRDSAED
ncbi:MAG: ATP-binding protein [Parvularculaceae bacterium]